MREYGDWRPIPDRLDIRIGNTEQTVQAGVDLSLRRHRIPAEVYDAFYSASVGAIEFEGGSTVVSVQRYDGDAVRLSLAAMTDLEVELDRRNQWMRRSMPVMIWPLEA